MVRMDLALKTVKLFEAIERDDCSKTYTLKQGCTFDN